MDDKYFNARSIKGKYQAAIASRTAEALQLFCFQSPEFTQAVEQSGKSYQECLDSVAEKIHGRQSISDFDVFKMATEFYFLGAVIHFDMRIDLGEEQAQQQPKTEEQAKTKSDIELSLDSLLDF